MLHALTDASADSNLDVWVAISIDRDARRRTDSDRRGTDSSDQTRIASTRPGDHVIVNHAPPRCGIGQWSVCEVIDPVGTVHESCVLGLEDEKSVTSSVVVRC